MKWILSVFIFVLVFFNPLLAQEVIQFYVAPTGQANANGTSEATRLPPGCCPTSHPGAKASRQLTKPVVVHLRGGTYPLQSRLYSTKKIPAPNRHRSPTRPIRMRK